MALLLHCWPETHKGIFNWINKSFPWYANRVSEAFWEQKWERYFAHSNKDEASAAVTRFQHELQLVLQSYEFPSYKTPDEVPLKWSIKRPEGLEVIRPILDADKVRKSGSLDFFSLPAELRNLIYDMAFQYPTGPGLTLPKWIQKTLRFDIALQQVNKRAGTTIQMKDIKNTRPVGRILDPLLTCRQFHKEAMPSFYHINNFCFEDLDSFSRWLKKLTLKRG